MASSDLTPHKQSRLIVSKEKDVTAYRGWFGSIQVRKSVKNLQTPRGKLVAISQEQSILFAPSFVRKALEWRYRKSLAQMSRNLSDYSVIPNETEVFRHGLIGKFRMALSRREISPFVRDKMGGTLPHHAGSYADTRFCSLLIQLGVDGD